MRQELLHHANRPAQIDFNLSSDVFEASSFVVNIDLTHDAGVVDHNVELRKLVGDLFVKSGDRFRIGNVALKGVNFWKGHFRTVQLSLITACDKNRVTQCRELFGEFVFDAAGTAGDQNRIAREFHNLSSLCRRPTDDPPRESWWISAIVIGRGATVGFRPDAVTDSWRRSTSDADNGCEPPRMSGWAIAPVCQSCAMMRPPAACTASVTKCHPRT